MLLRDEATREQEIKWNRLQLMQIKNKHKICAEVAKNAASAQILCLFFIPTNSNRFYFISCSLVALSLRSIFHFLSTINTFYTVASTKYFFQESDTEKCSLALKHTIYMAWITNTQHFLVLNVLKWEAKVLLSFAQFWLSVKILWDIS